jgi:hypothetical protein
MLNPVFVNRFFQLIHIVLGDNENVGSVNNCFPSDLITLTDFQFHEGCNSNPCVNIRYISWKELSGRYDGRGGHRQGAVRVSLTHLIEDLRESSKKPIGQALASLCKTTDPRD